VSLLFALALALGAPSPSPAPGVGGRPEKLVGGHGTLDKEVIRGVIRVHLDEVKACYEEGLGRRDMAGRVMVQFTIQGSGSVSSAVVQSTTLNDAAVEKCICGRVMGWRFPKPLGGGIVIVSYPFVLKTNNLPSSGR
jgi:outer membrane biosynthesis protein TonB